MKLLEEIKKAEETAENMRRNAQNAGLELIERARTLGEKEISTLDHSRDVLFERALKKTQKAIDEEIRTLARQHEQTIVRVTESFSKNKETAIRKIQELILKWPLSR